MPCNDITEIVRIRLDSENRLRSFDIVKQTCGSSIGRRNLIFDAIYKKSCEEIMDLDEEELFVGDNRESDTDKFLARKRLFALKSALAVYKGMAPGSRSEKCVIWRISVDEGDVFIDAEIKFELRPDVLENCGCSESYKS